MMNGNLDKVSIPQAVGTVATITVLCLYTARIFVSIPQAVGTVATSIGKATKTSTYAFQYRKR